MFRSRLLLCAAGGNASGIVWYLRSEGGSGRQYYVQEDAQGNVVAKSYERPTIGKVMDFMPTSHTQRRPIDEPRRKVKLGLNEYINMLVPGSILLAIIAIRFFPAFFAVFVPSPNSEKGKEKKQ